MRAVIVSRQNHPKSWSITSALSTSTGRIYFWLVTSVVRKLNCPASRTISSTGTHEADSRLTKACPQFPQLTANAPSDLPLAIAESGCLGYHGR